jgi:rhodanese-related sulfurtransferase
MIDKYIKRVKFMNEFEVISTDELQEQLEKGLPETHVIIDVREDEEVGTGMIPGATHIRLGTLPERFEELDRDKTYIMVCRSGRRSEKASEFLYEQGFKVINMDGGMLKWQGEIKA